MDSLRIGLAQPSQPLRITIHDFAFAFDIMVILELSLGILAGSRARDWRAADLVLRRTLGVIFSYVRQVPKTHLSTDHANIDGRFLRHRTWTLSSMASQVHL